MYMNDISPMLMCDFYKTTHPQQFPKGTTKLVSYFTPRKSRLNSADKVVVFGFQGFCKEILIDFFGKWFETPENEALSAISHVLDNSIGKQAYDVEKMRELHQLGYLPIEISALPEGTKCPMHVPFMRMENTHDDFAWVPQFLESLISAETWHPMICATVGMLYRNIVNKYYDKTCDDNLERCRALGDFSFRGQESFFSAIKSSAAWCLSFVNTATVPTIPYLEKNYNCDCSKDKVGYGAISTEHSVMCSNAAVDGDEITMLRRLLTELYPDSSFSVVSDSYDYWNLVDNILPKLYNEIMNHNGTILIRGDSGNPVDIVTETVYHLWNIFGGKVNSKGYKVLDPHVKAIYGDSITVGYCEEIYKRLEKAGFAASNVSLGVGSFSMQCIIEDGKFSPFTRDTFCMAIKATYGVINGKEVKIFKDPVTDKDSFKKSIKGLCAVYEEDGEIKYRDDLYQSDYDEYTKKNGNLFEVVFRDGKMVKEETLGEIRNRLWDGKF